MTTEPKKYLCSQCGTEHSASELFHYLLDRADTAAITEDDSYAAVLNCYGNFDEAMIDELLENGTIVLCSDHLSVEKINNSSGGILSPIMSELVVVE